MTQFPTLQEQEDSRWSELSQGNWIAAPPTVEGLLSAGRSKEALGVFQGYTPEQVRNALLSQERGAKFAMIADMTRDLDQAWRSSWGVAPDKEAQVQFIATYMNTSPNVVRENLPWFKQALVFQKNRSRLRGAPKTLAFLSDPKNLAQAWDQTESLIQLEGLLRGRHASVPELMWQGIKNMELGFEAGVMATTQGTNEILGSVFKTVAGVVLTPLIEFGIVSGAAAKDLKTATDWWDGKMVEPTKAVRQRLFSAMTPLTDEVGGLKRFIVDVPAAVGQMAGFAASGIIHPGAPLALIGLQEVGGLYGDLRDRDVPMWEAAALAWAGGGANALIERMQIKKAVSLLGARAGFQKHGVAYTGHLVKVVLENASQEVFQNMISETALISGDAGQRSVSFPEIKSRITEAWHEGMYEGLLAGTATALFSVPRLTNAIRRISVSNANRQRFELAHEAVKTLAERNPDLAKEAVQGDVAGTEIENTSLSAAGVETVFHTMEDGEVFRKELLKRLGVSEVDYQVALENGRDIIFETGDWIAKVHDTAIGLELYKHIRLGDNLTQAESEVAKEKLLELAGELHGTIGQLSAIKEQTPEGMRELRRVLREDGEFTSEQADFIMLLSMKLTEFVARGESISLVDAFNKLGLEFHFDADSAQFLTKEQAEEGKKAGFTSFADGKTILRVFTDKAIKQSQRADTLLHELGHIFLRVAREQVADERIVKDLQTLDKFVQKFDRSKQSEKIVKAWSAYIMEGRAPTAELARAFVRFRRWLVDVYRTVRTLLGQDRVPVELRAVFDHWLATDAELIAAEAYYAKAVEYRALAETLVPKKKPAKMAEKPQEPSEPEEVSTEQERLERARERAQEAREKALDKEALKRVALWLADYEGGRAGLRVKAEKEVLTQALYAALVEIKQAKGLSELVVYGLFDEATPAVIIDTLRKQHGQKIVKDTPAKLTTNPGMLAEDLDTLVKKYNFVSPQALIAALMDAPSYNDAVTICRQEMEDELFQQFREQVELQGLNPSEKILHSDAQLEYLLVENELLAQTAEKKIAAKIRRVEMQALKDETMENLVTTMDARTAMRYDRWAKAEQREALAAVEAAKKGNWEELQSALDRRLHFFLRAQASLKLREWYAKNSSKWKTNSIKLASLESNYVDTIRDLVSHYRMNDSIRPPDEVGPHLAEIAGELTDEYTRILVPSVEDLLLPWITNKERTEQWDKTGEGSIKDLSFRRIQELHESLMLLVGRARGALKAIQDEKIHTHEELVGALVARLSELPERQERGTRTFLDRLKRLGPQLVGAMGKLEFLFGWADGNSFMRGQEMGPHQKLLFVTLNKAEIEYTKRMQLLMKGDKATELIGFNQIKVWLADARKKVESKRGKLFSVEGVVFPEAKKRDPNYAAGLWDFEAVFMALLNRGNAGNLFALKNGYGLSDGDLDRLAQVLPDEAVEAAEAIWAMFESTRPEWAQLKFDMTNRELKLVKATPFSVLTVEGRTRKVTGGYFPLAFDETVDPGVAALKETQEVLNKARQDSIYAPGHIQAGSQVSRLESKEGKPVVKKPPLLFSSVILRTLKDVVKGITSARALQEVDKVTRDPKWREAFTDKLGKDAYDAVRKWAKDQFQPERFAPGFFNRLLYWGKRQLTIVALGLGSPVALKQQLSITTGIGQLKMGSGGKEGVSASVARFVRSTYWLGGDTPFGLAKRLIPLYPMLASDRIEWVNNLSDEMSIRGNRISRDMWDIVSQMSEKELSLVPGALSFKIAGKQMTLREMQDAVFVLIRANDRAVVYPLWHAAYHQARDLGLEGIDLSSMSEEEIRERAVRYADATIRLSQPMAKMVDQTTFQRARGSAAYMLSMFQSWMSIKGNRLLYLGKTVKQGDIKWHEAVNHWFGEFVLQVMVQMVMPALLYDDEDKPEWWEWGYLPLADLANWVPLGSDATHLIQSAIAGKKTRRLGELSGLEIMRRFQEAFEGAPIPGVSGTVKHLWGGWRLVEYMFGVPITNPLKDIMRYRAKLENKRRGRRR